MVLVVPGFTGCGNPAASTQNNGNLPDDTFSGSQWKLISIDGTPLVPGSYISLYFGNGKVWGSNSINIYGGKYSVEGPNTLTFSDIVSTLIGGPENIIHQGDLYLKYINDTAGYRFDGNHLEISGMAKLVFERLPEYPMNPSELVGTKWQFVSLNGEPVMEGLSINLNFETDSLASGHAGNFTYELPYEAKGDDIRWGISSGRTGNLSQELEHHALRYLDSISWAANYRLTKDKLEIFTARGDTLVYEPLTDSIK